MEISRRRDVLRALSLTAMGMALLIALQGHAIAIEEPGDVEETVGTAAEEATATVETTTDEVTATVDAATEETTATVDAATATVETQVEEVPAAEVSVEAPLETTNAGAPDVDGDASNDTAGNGASGAPESSPSDEGTQTSTPDPTAVPATHGAQANASVDQVDVGGPAIQAVAMRSFQKKLDPELEALIAAGNDVEGPIVLGERIKSTSSRVEAEDPRTAPGSELAFTGADLASLVGVALLMLLFGSRAATSKSRRPVRISSPVREGIIHLRFA